MTTTPLPPLPTPKGKVYFEAEPYQPAWVSSSDAFDDDQTQAYAQQARADLEAENQRLRDVLRQAESKLIELEHAVGGGDDEIYVEGVILSIRAALKSKP